MGNYLPVFNTTKNTIKVWYLNKDQIIEVPSTLTLKQLRNDLDKLNNGEKEIFYNWSPIDSKYENHSLQKIIAEHQKEFPLSDVEKRLFVVIDQGRLLEGQQFQLTRQKKLFDKLKYIEKADERNLPSYQIGHNGRIVFEGRQAALFASGVSLGLQKSSATPQQLQTLLQNYNPNKVPLRKPSLIGKLLTKIGLLHKNNEQLSKQKLSQLAQKLKSSKQFSDFDPKFVYFILQIYFKFMIMNKCKIHYIDYNHIEDFGIQYISSKSKIGIIGDFGTGLKDSIELLNNMIMKHDVDVIFHLGDVYYAGTPLEYQVGIVKPLNQLRVKADKQIRFYSIPGNHDYYSWGLPFLCFVKGINQKEFHKQKTSYFCIRDQLNKWQFLGMDTAYFDSNPLGQIEPSAVGPHVQQKELLWHKHRLQNFPGSTILMTHHQLFSIHERINGKLSKYRKFSCINPMLSAQMFEHMGNISAWFWGHEHSMMLFKQNLFGLPKGRLLGNSSFHVMYDKQNPYTRQKGYPYIPFVVQDKQYLQKYLPVNPNIPVDDFFALSYAVIDMGRMDELNSLPVEYWCSPSYSDDQIKSLGKMSEEDRKKVYFDEYKMYEEQIFSIEKLRKQRITVQNQNKVYLRSQIGLALTFDQQTKLKENQTLLINSDKIIQEQTDLDGNKQGKQVQAHFQAQDKKNSLSLNLQGSAFEITILSQKSIGNHQLWEFTLKLISNQSQKNLYLGVVNSKVKLIKIQSSEDLINQNAIWMCQNMDHQKHMEGDSSIYYCQPIKIHNKILKKSLTWQIIKNDAYPVLQDPQYELKQQELQIERINQQNLECLWMFERENLIHE